VPIYRLTRPTWAAPNESVIRVNSQSGKVALRIFSNVTINSYCRGSCRSSLVESFSRLRIRQARS